MPFLQSLVRDQQARVAESGGGPVKGWLKRVAKKVFSVAVRAALAEAARQAAIVFVKVVAVRLFPAAAVVL
jgi:hypothetical protein